MERHAASILGGERVQRDWLAFESAPDVYVPLPDGRQIVADAKAYRKFSHHTLLDTCHAKYCGADDIPALVTKHAGQRGAYITLPLAFVAELLTIWREAAK